jgi:hypothetical protein
MSSITLSGPGLCVYMLVGSRKKILRGWMLAVPSPVEDCEHELHNA